MPAGNIQYSKADLLHKGKKSKHHWLHTYRKASVLITDATYWAECEAAGKPQALPVGMQIPTHAECRNPACGMQMQYSLWKTDLQVLTTLGDSSLIS